MFELFSIHNYFADIPRASMNQRREVYLKFRDFPIDTELQILYPVYVIVVVIVVI
jgi:hypothetical protein